MIRLILLSAALISLAGCRAGGGDQTLQVDNSLPQEQTAEDTGIVSAFAKRFQGTRNKNEKPTAIKPTSSRKVRRIAREPETADEPLQTNRAENNDASDLLGAFEGSSPEVQAAARRLAAAKTVRQPIDSQPATVPEPAANTNARQRSQLVAQTVGEVRRNPKATESPIKQAAASIAADQKDSQVAFATPPTDPIPEEVEPSEEKTRTIELEQPSPEEAFTELPFEKQIDAVISKLESLDSPSVETSEGLRQATNLRMLYLLAGKPDEAMKPIEDLTSTEQDYVRHQLMTLWNIADPEGSPTRARRWNAALENLRLASSNLAAATESLEVTGSAFCTEVESYGRITPFNEYKFEPGQQVILYCEIDHFAAERLSDGYETNFQGSYDVFNAEGVRVAEQVLPADKQTCNNFRRDYFIAYRLYLPKRLKPGAHRIQLTIEDLKGKKYGQTVLDFEVIEKKTAGK